MRNALLFPLVRWARRELAAGSTEGRLMPLLLVGFTAQAMVMFQAHALARRARELRRPLAAPAWAPLSRAMAGRQPVPLPKFPAGCAPTPALRVPAALRRAVQARRFWRWNGPSVRALRSWDRTREVACIAPDRLVNHHAMATEAIVRYVPLWTWFNLPAPAKSAAGMGLEEPVRVAEKAFLAGGEEASPGVGDHLAGWLQESMRALGPGRAAMDRTRDRLPRKLWTVAMGNPWIGILRQACMENDAEVTGHDHGPGVGFIRWPFRSLYDYAFCSNFVTFNEAQARGLRESVDSRLLLQDRPPAILPVPPARRPARRAPQRPAAETPRSVMYTGTYYWGERLHLDMNPPDLVQVDWEARLFHHLLEWRYEAIHKPHPGVASPPPEFQRWGVRMLTEPYEQVMDAADVVVMPGVLTSIFVPTIRRGKAVVVVDFGVHEWAPGALKLLRDRCAVVRGWIDKENRLQVAWPDLRDAIRLAPSLTSPAFQATYIDMTGEAG